jgi:hypothetical protein
MLTYSPKRIHHLEAAAAFHEAVQYRKSFLRYTAKGIYHPSANYAAWTEKYADKGKALRATAKLLTNFA